MKAFRSPEGLCFSFKEIVFFITYNKYSCFILPRIFKKNILARRNTCGIITYCRQDKQSIFANVAQQAERLIRNEQVSGSIPLIGSIVGV